MPAKRILCRSHQQSQRGGISTIIPYPIEQNRNFCPRSQNTDQVYQHPQHPREPAGECHLSYLRDRLVASHSSHNALVFIYKLSPDSILVEILRKVARLLNGGLSHLRVSGRVIFSLHNSDIAYCENICRSLHFIIFIDQYPSTAPYHLSGNPGIGSPFTPAVHISVSQYSECPSAKVTFLSL